MSERSTLARDLALEVISDMPADSTLDDIIRELVVRKMIEEGLADVDAGRVIPHDEVVRQVETWLNSSGRRVPPAA